MKQGKTFSNNNKILTGIIVLVLVGLLVLGNIAFLNNYEQSQKEGVQDSIHAVFHTVREGIISWRNQEIANANLWASQPGLVRITQELLSLEPSKDPLTQSVAQKQIRDLLKPVYDSKQYRGFFIISPDGISLASTRDTNIGTRNLILDLPGVFETAIRGITLVTRPQPSDVSLLDETEMRFRERMPTMFVATPIKDNQGNTIAVLTIRIRPEVSLYPILKQGRIGDSGESYLFDEAGTLLSESRFTAGLREKGYLKRDQISPFNIKLRPGINSNESSLTHAVKQAVIGNEGYHVEGYLDYRGEPVVGNWSWFPELSVGLVTEQDVAEAYSNLTKIRSVAWAAVVLISLMLTAMGIIFSTYSSRLAAMVGERTRELEIEKIKFQAIIDGAFDAMVIINDDGIIELFNPSATRLFGYKPDELLGQNVKILTPDTIAEAHDGYIQRYQDTGEARLIGKVREVEARHSDGSFMWVALSLIEIGEGEQHRFVGFIQDIRDRKRLENEGENYNRTLFEKSPAGLMLVSDDGLFFDVNPAFSRIVEQSPEALKNTPLMVLVNPEHKKMLQQQLDQLHNAGDGYGPVEIELMQESGAYVLVRLLGRTLIKDGKHFIWSAVEDVSEQRAYEKALTEARDHAEHANTAKSQFLANMSHELRTPLNAVIGYAEMLEEDAEEDGHDEIIPDLQRITGSAKHLLRLINDVLDISKIEAGKQELFIVSFDVLAMLDDIRDAMMSLTSKKNNQFEIRCDDHIFNMVGDEQRLKQILFNLVGNAAKFTENGNIALVVNLSRGQGKEWIVFKVCDSGIGMTAEHIKKIFDPFTQADGSTTRKYGGTGLGLSIVSQFVDLMEGTLDITSEPDNGATFIVTLPLIHSSHLTEVTLPDQQEAAPQIPQIANHKRPLILVIEDSVDSLDMMRRILEKHGFQVVSAVTGNAGLELAQGLKPDVIVLDIMLPGINGWSVLQELKGQPDTMEIPVVLCSSLDETRRGYVLGASAYLRKPTNHSEFIHTIQRLLPNNLQLADISILIVEDDPDASLILQRLLNKHVKNVEIAENGRIGIEKLNQSKSDLIILDLMMPEVDGFEFLQQIRSTSEFTSIPVIVVSAKSLSIDEMELLKTDVHQVFNKAEYHRNDLLGEIIAAVQEGSGENQGDQS